MKPYAFAFIGYTGQEISDVLIPSEGELPSPDEILVSGPAVETDRIRYMRAVKGIAPGDVTDVRKEDGEAVRISFVPFTTRSDFSIKVRDKVYVRNDLEIHTRTADDRFARLEEGRVMFRLYTPFSEGKRPLILFLHGGGNGGYEGERDNNKQIITDFGPVNFAEMYPDVYVMAPMAVEARRDMSTFNPNGRFQDSDKMNVPGYGWSRDYLALICDIIRRMINEGKVDGKRVYVTGMSMGGAGTIRAVSVGSDLFAAAVPVCPTMTPETFSILSSVRIPIWVASAYIDHTLYRHKYLVDAVMSMKDSGNNNAHLTLYSPEELEKYDISITPDLPYKRLFSENHASWVPTYMNEHGIMSWLMNQSKSD